MTAIFPAGIGSPVPSRPGMGLTIVFASEAYSSSTDFELAVFDLWEALTEIAPFAGLDTAAGNTSVYTWFDPADSAPFGVSVNGDGSLVTDPDSVLSMLAGLELTDLRSGETVPALDELPWANLGATTYAAALLVVVVNPTHLSGQGEWRGVTRPEVPYHVVVTPGEHAPYVVAKAIGRVGGLAGENADASREPAWAMIRPGPNAITQDNENAVSRGEAWDPWLAWRGSAAFDVAEVIKDAGNGIELPVRVAEAGGLMGLDIGTIGADAVTELERKARGLGYAARMGLGAWWQSSRVRIDHQRLRYEEAGFQSETPIAAPGSVPQAVNTHPTDRWKYLAEVGTHGLSLHDVWVDTTGSMGHFMPQPVAEWIEFLDLAVTIEAPAGATRQILAIPLASGLPAHTTAVQGTQPRDPTYQEGVLYRTVVPVQGSSPATSVVVQVELACAFRGPAQDFDPPGAIEALQFFPQISIKQVPPFYFGLSNSVYAGDLVEFTGTVRMVSDVNTPSMMRQHMIADYFGASPTPAQQASFTTGGENYAAFFTDMYNLNWNVLAPELRLLYDSLLSAAIGLIYSPPSGRISVLRGLLTDISASIRLLQAGWMGIFDCAQRLQTTHDAHCVHGPNDAHFRRYRYGQVHLPWAAMSTGNLVRTIYKEPRQGAYDNIHVHGTMGTVGDIDAATPNATPRVMAPGCGHSCFHSHWRWGNTTYFLSGFNSPNLWGAMQLGACAVLFDALDAVLDHPTWPADDQAAWIADTVWYLLPDFLAPPLGVRYKGWSAEGANSYQHSVVGATMIPPNQSLHVVVGPRPAGLGQPLPGGTLGATTKTVEFRTTVNCEYPYLPWWRHCLVEFGAGVAVRYPPSPAEYGLRLLTASYYLPRSLDPADLAYLPPWFLNQLNAAGFPNVPASPYTASRVFTHAYDVIPFLDSTNPVSLAHASADGTAPLLSGQGVLEDL